MAVPWLQIVLALASAGLGVLVLFWLSKWLAPAVTAKSKLKQELYASGETVQPRKRKYLSSSVQWLCLFSVLHILGFMIGTLIILSASRDLVEFAFPLLYILIAIFVVLALAGIAGSASRRIESTDAE